MNEQPNREVAVLNAALELPPAERAAYLDQECANDVPLRRRVEELVQAHAQAEGFLETPPSGLDFERTVRVPIPLIENPGDRIGRYRLLQQIGEGGYGVVYMAEQEEPVRRRVALKVVKLGMDTRQVIARFEAERQSLAMMDHPNIAKVFDAGATETGRPFFVMELVRGVRITEYCDQNQLSTVERLRLFVQVCSAVQHAHQKGVIHRDIKPSNVLVTPNDPDPLGVPKVIDFGIAKATGQPLTDKTLFTDFHHFIGTPAYMSPEQAGRSAQDIDTRSDIYSLGVLLYELLTGQTPFDAKELLQRGLDEMLRVVRDEEPPKPSTRLTQTPVAADVSPLKSKGTGKVRADSRRLLQEVRGDLDWIVMKALEKDRARRYETANGLAADIQRHLNNEPVVARPPSALYRFRKFARRNKVAFATIASVATALVVGAIGSTWQAVRATRAEHAAASAQASAQQRLYDALVGEARAIRLARRVGYRNDVFELLQQANSLDVPRRDPIELRREALACLGDAVGLAPVALGTIPDGGTIASHSNVRLDPDGTRAAFVLSDGSILLRDAVTGRELARLAGELPAWRCRFDATGTRLVSVHLPAGEDFHERISGAWVQVWIQAADGRWLGNSKASVPGAMDCFLAANRLLVLANNRQEQTIEVLDAMDLSVVHRLNDVGNPRFDAWAALPVISPDARWLAIPAGQRVRMWDLNTGSLAIVINPTDMFRLTSLLFSPDGNHLAIFSARGCAVHELSRFNRLATLGESARGTVQSAFGSDGILALPLTGQNRVRLFDAPRNRDVAVLDVPFEPGKADFSADGSRLLVAGERESCVFQLDLQHEKLTLPGDRQGVPGMCFSPDGSKLATVSLDLTLKVWDSRTGTLVWQATRLPNQGGRAIAWSPDGRYLATTHFSSWQIWIWDAHSGEHIQTLDVPQPPSGGGVGRAIRFSPDGRHLLAAHEPVGLLCWPVESASTDKPIGSLATTVPGSFQNLAIAPNSRVAVFGPRTGAPTLHMWHLTGNDLPAALTGDILQTGQNANFTPDSRRLVFLDARRNVVIYDVASGAPVRSFPTVTTTGSSAGMLNLSLSPNAVKVAITSPTQRGVDLYEMETGRMLYSLPTEPAVVEWLEWAPDNRRLAVSRSAGDIAIWNLSEVEQVLTKLGLNP